MKQRNLKNIKSDFPILKQKVNGLPLVYLDNAATSQKPKQVVKAMVDFYRKDNANIHRGIHSLGDRATKAYDQSRQTVSDFINANHKNEIVFTRNTTESINLVAQSWGQTNLKKGDVILSTQMEHHSNIVPWQIVAQKTKASLQYVSLNQDGTLNLKDFKSKLSKKVKLVAFVHASNFLGTINPVKQISKLAHKYGAKVLVDGAQAIPHLPVDIKDMGVDFYCFSGHKMLGPMGIGVLWGRLELLSDMPPFMTGGGMINQVSFDHSTYAELPDKFDAGTPNVAGAVGLAAAVNYLNQIGLNNIHAHEMALTKYALEKLTKIKGLKVFGPLNPTKRTGLVAFTLDRIHAHDVAQILDRKAGVAVRSGHHCTMPIHVKLNLAATTRASFYLYNDNSDIDSLVAGLNQVKKIFA